jgi:hypothetical protein
MGWFRQENIGNRWNMEAIFRPENFRIFPDDFQPVPAGSGGRKLRSGMYALNSVSIFTHPH